MLLGVKNTFLIALALVLLVLVWAPRPSNIPSSEDVFRYTNVGADTHPEDNKSSDTEVPVNVVAVTSALHSPTSTSVTSTAVSSYQEFHIATAPHIALLTSTSAAAVPLETEFIGVPDRIPDIEDVDPSFGGDRWYFQEDVQFPPPKLDVLDLKRYAPHNYRGPGHDTFATYLATRNGSIHDPYFCAAQQLVFRLLWDPEIKSAEHPITVFVAPFVDQTQRDVLAAAGALVREIELVAWHPTDVSLPVRWRDQFSKLNFWSQTDFSRIAYLDTDAFPLHNVDELLSESLVPEQTCDRDLLSEEDEPYAYEICEYAFGAYEQDRNMVNGGVLVLKPNAAMHDKLIRGMEAADFDASAVEQGLLSKVFHKEGPFPVSWFERKWNGFFSKNEDDGKFMIMHEKLWALYFQENDLPWAANYFNDTWFDMLKLYETEEFRKLRELDGLMANP